MVAFDGNLAVGWCQLTPRDDVPWLDRAWRLKRVDQAPVWSLSCFYVRPGYRRRGIPSGLIAAALKAAKRAGAVAVEAYPLDANRTSSASWTGYATTFERAGFKTVACHVHLVPSCATICGLSNPDVAPTSGICVKGIEMMGPPADSAESPDRSRFALRGAVYKRSFPGIAFIDPMAARWRTESTVLCRCAAHAAPFTCQKPTRMPIHAPIGAPGPRKVELISGNSPFTAGRGRAR